MARKHVGTAYSPDERKKMKEKLERLLSAQGGSGRLEIKSFNNEKPPRYEFWYVD